MYPVSQRYKDEIKKLSRTFSISVIVTPVVGTPFTLTDQNFKQGSVVFDDLVMSNNTLEIGSTIAKSFECEIILNSVLKQTNLAEAKVEPTITLFLPANQTYPTPSSEAIPMGIFHVDSVVKGRKTTKLKALDNLSRLDEDYSKSTLVYPATLAQIYSDICSFLGVQEDPNFTTYSYTVPRKPKKGVTFRNVLGSLAEINGSYARCDRFGRPCIQWLSTNDAIATEIDPHTRSKLKTDDFIQPITGVSMETISNTFTGSGSQPGNVIDLSDNLLIQNNQQTILDNFSNLGIYDQYVIPHNTVWSGDPSIDAGDRISVITIDDDAFNTNITTNKHKYHGSCEASCGAQLKGSTNVIPSGSKNQKDAGDATAALAAAMGVFTTADGSGYYIHNQPTLEDSTEIWSGDTVVEPPPGYGYPWLLAIDDDFIAGSYGVFGFDPPYGSSHVVLPQSIQEQPITSYQHMFEQQALLEGVINTNRFITNMSYTFALTGASVSGGLGTLDLSRFNTQSVLIMSYMFYKAKYMTVLINLFDTSKVVNMSNMFRDSTIENIDLSVFNTSSVENMQHMFDGAHVFDLDFSNFNTSKVFGSGLSSGFEYMFRGLHTHHLYLSSFDTHLATSMAYMFQNTTALYIDVSSFNTNKVTNMSYMFAGIAPLDPLNLTSFSTLMLKNTSYMFNNAHLTTIDLRSFNMSGVTNTANMFAGCTATVGIARTQDDADILNATTGKPVDLIFYPI